MTGPAPLAPPGLRSLRRPGTIADLLFLEACLRLEPTQLRPLAAELGVTVQAASHTFRTLQARGWVARRDGRYRLTLQGTAWLHRTLADLDRDVRARLQGLHIIRSTRAIADRPLAVGETVSLEIRDGLLTARRGASGRSRGRVLRGGAAGSLIEVGELEGIVPITPAPIRVRPIPESSLHAPELAARIARELRTSKGPVAVEGLEAYVLVRRATSLPLHRFAPTAVCREASRLGVPSTLFVLEKDLARALGELAVPSPPPVEVLPLGGRRPSGASRGPR